MNYTSVIETHDLTKRYDKLTAVNKLNLKIEEGEIFLRYLFLYSVSPISAELV